MTISSTGAYEKGFYFLARASKSPRASQTPRSRHSLRYCTDNHHRTSQCPTCDQQVNGFLAHSARPRQLGWQERPLLVQQSESDPQSVPCPPQVPGESERKRISDRSRSRTSGRRCRSKPSKCKTRERSFDFSPFTQGECIHLPPPHWPPHI
jgi:hypothetical protein